MLDAIMREVLSRRATEPKDKSYGVDAILASQGVELEPPDRLRSQGDTYKELFTQLLAATTNLNLLLLACGRFDDHPSWNLDWAQLDEDRWRPAERLLGFAVSGQTDDEDARDCTGVCISLQPE
jgi:hypothetical protein